MDTEVSDTSVTDSTTDALDNPNVDLEDSTNLDDVQKVQLYKKRYEMAKSKAKELKDKTKKSTTKGIKGLIKDNAKDKSVSKKSLSNDKSKIN